MTVVGQVANLPESRRQVGNLPHELATCTTLIQNLE